MKLASRQSKNSNRKMSILRFETSWLYKCFASVKVLKKRGLCLTPYHIFILLPSLKQNVCIDELVLRLKLWKSKWYFFLNTMPFDENLFDFFLCETDLNVFFHFVLFIGFSFSCYLLDDNVLFSCKNTPIRVMRNCSGRVSKDFDELHVCSIFWLYCPGR